MVRRLIFALSCLIIAILPAAGCAIITGAEPAPVPVPVSPPNIQIPPGGIPTYHPEGVRQLTDGEKAKITDIALNTREALKWREKESQYRTSIGWVAIAWKDETRTDYSEIRSYPYDIIDKGVEKGGIDISAPGSTVKVFTTAPPASAIFYPNVVIHFGQDWVVSVAIDLKTFQVVRESSSPNLSSPNRFPGGIIPKP